ncbi:MAG: hypothetical protein ABIP13_10770 [Tepidiformaceae bacterium]
MDGDIHVHDFAPAMIDEEEDVERPKREGWQGEEVARPNLWRVVLKEGAPGLGRRAAASLVHVPAYRFAANLVAEAQELAADTLGFSEQVLLRHPDDEVSEFGSDSRPPTCAVTALPCPAPLPGIVMPADDGFRLNEDRTPWRPATGQPDPEEAAELSCGRLPSRL